MDWCFPIASASQYLMICATCEIEHLAAERWMLLSSVKWTCELCQDDGGSKTPDSVDATEALREQKNGRRQSNYFTLVHVYLSDELTTIPTAFAGIFRSFVDIYTSPTTPCSIDHFSLFPQEHLVCWTIRDLLEWISELFQKLL